MALPNLLPPFAATAPYNCTFKIKANVSTDDTNALGNRIISFTEIEVSGYAVRTANPRLLETIGASVDEVPLKVWIQDPDTLPVDFAAFNNVKCELTLGTKTQSGIFRPVPMGHPFVPSSFQFVIGAFKGY